jgi:nucleotide-binding universal stress UspA family protein
MFRNILVAVDGTSTSQRGLKVAVELALDQKATLHVVHVVDDMTFVPMEVPYAQAAYIKSMGEGLRETGRKLLAKAESFARERQVDVHTILAVSKGYGVAMALLREAKRRKVDVIVLGTHGRRGLRRLLLGSDAEMVLREAQVPVLLVRAPEPGAVKRSVAASKPAARGSRATATRKGTAGARATLV